MYQTNVKNTSKQLTDYGYTSKRHSYPTLSTFLWENLIITSTIVSINIIANQYSEKKSLKTIENINREY